MITLILAELESLYIDIAFIIELIVLAILVFVFGSRDKRLH